MTGLLLGAAILAAVAVVGTRAWKARRDRAAEDTWLDRPGYAADKPLAVQRYDELDDFVELARCPCGGLLDRIGEGSRTSARGRVRVVRTTCTTCERDVDLFFELTAIRH